MKRILITGANSYIGMSFEKYMQKWPDDYRVDTLDMLDEAWYMKDFSIYDIVFHVAGIAHIKETNENAHLYYKINRDLAIKVAKKAKEEGVRQFVFLSSMSVYGVDEGIISKSTLPKPISNYGKSKLQAEEGLKLLEDNQFILAILRPPMVYGDGCKGNYQSLIKLAEKLPVFPNYQNVRSMISIDNLVGAVKKIVDQELGGMFYPQDESYVCTSQMVRQIAMQRGKIIKLVNWLNPLVILAKRFTRAGRKAFGDLYYMRECDGNRGE